MIQKLFGTQSAYIWNILKDSEASGIRQGEDSITDGILLSIYRSKIEGIKSLNTPKIKESLSGCDWEWWIGSHKYGWMRYAIQAKKVQSHNGYYGSLNHKVGKGHNKVRQVDILLNYAKANNAIPLYCFYNYSHLNSSELKKLWHADFKFDKKQFGWTYTPAQNIKTILDLNKRGYGRFFEDIHELSDTLPMKSLIDEHHMYHKTNGVLSHNIAFPRGYHEKLPRNIDHGLSDWAQSLNEHELTYFRKPKKDNDSGIYYYKEVPDYSRILGKSPDYWERNSIGYVPEFYNQELQKYPKKIMVIDFEE